MYVKHSHTATTILVLLTLIPAACGSDGGDDGSTTPSTSGSGGSGGQGAAASGGGGGLGGDEGALCGNNVIEGSEECDDGPLGSNTTPDACRLDCTLPRCSDGVVDPGYGEVCDPANLTAGEQCSADCHEHRAITDLSVSGTAYDLARDNNGGVHLLWKTGNELRYGRVETGSVVGIQTLPQSGGVHTRFTRPRLAVRPDGGTVHTAWINATGSVGQYLFHSWRNEDGAWQPRQTVFNGGAGQRVAVPALGVGADGTVQIIVEQRDLLPTEGNWQIVNWRKPQGDPWPTSPQTIHGPTGLGWRACSLFTDMDGGVHATWKGPNQPGKYRYAANGQSLAAGTTIDIPKPAGESHVSNGDSYVTANGEVHHAFVTFPNLGIFHVTKGAGDNHFGTPTPVATAHSSELYDPWPTLGVDPSGRVLLSWAEDRETMVNQNAGFPWLAMQDDEGWTQEEWDTTAHIHRYGRTAIAVSGASTFLLWRNEQDQLMLARFTFAEAP